MAVALASRFRALWLVCLLVLTPAGPLGLVVSDHGPGEGVHAATILHDESDHGISAGALAEHDQDRHCFYCQSTSSLRFGWSNTTVAVHAPACTPVDWPEPEGDLLRDRLRHALPARAPPRAS